MNIDEIRKAAIGDIKEKVGKNHKYLHPCNKEMLDDMKRLMFISGNDFIVWMQKNGILKNPTNIKREYKDKWAKEHGYDDDANYQRDLKKGNIEYLMKKEGFDNIDEYQYWLHQNKEENWYISLENKYGKEFADWVRKNKGKVRDCVINAGCKTETEYNDKNAQKKGFKNSAEKRREWRQYNDPPLSDINESCSDWLGNITEDLMLSLYPSAIKMPPKNPGFDYFCDGVRIDIKGMCLFYDIDRSPFWKFGIKHNNIADKFVLLGYDNRENLIPMYGWEFDKNDIVRYGKRGEMKEFWKRESFTIIYSDKGLEEFKDYSIDISSIIKID